MGRPLYTEKQDYRQQEPDFDLPSSTLHERIHPSRSNKPRPAPGPVRQDRKVGPFNKKPITFMFHATYNAQLHSILEQGNKPGRAPRIHGRDALLILGFLKNNHPGIRRAEERACLNTPSVHRTSLWHMILRDRKCRPTSGS